MKIALISTREIEIDSIDKYIPERTSLLITGGASEIDTLAERYADKNGIPKLVIKSDYQKYKELAPLVRDRLIVQNADLIIAIWNRVSTETKLAIDYAKSLSKKIKLVLIDTTGLEILPGNQGKDCLGNVEHFDRSERPISRCCDECDFLQCCIEEQPNKCAKCRTDYCPRKY